MADLHRDRILNEKKEQFAQRLLVNYEFCSQMSAQYKNTQILETGEKVLLLKVMTDNQVNRMAKRVYVISQSGMLNSDKNTQLINRVSLGRSLDNHQNDVNILNQDNTIDNTHL